jgi:hypothetical protein
MIQSIEPDQEDTRPSEPDVLQLESKRLLLRAFPHQAKSIELATVRRNHEHATKLMCLDCAGGDRDAIRSCSGLGCPLWQVRPYRD